MYIPDNYDIWLAHEREMERRQMMYDREIDVEYLDEEEEDDEYDE